MESPEAESSISPSPTTSLSSLSWASSTSTETHTWQPLCLFRFLRPPPPTPPPQYHARVIRGTLTRSSERFTKFRHENLDREPKPRRKSQPTNSIILAPLRENLGTSAPELSEVLRTIQEAWPRQRSRSSASRREPRRDQDLRQPRTSCGCREEGAEGGGRQEEEEGEEEGGGEGGEEEEDEEEAGVSTEEEGDMGSSCRSGKAAEEGEARTGTTGGHQSFLPHQLPRRRYSVPEVVIRKFRLATEEQWAPQTTPPIPFPHKGNPLSTRPLVAEELSRTKQWKAEESPRKVTYQNRGSQIGGRLTYFGEPGSERLEISRPTPPPPESPPRQVMSLIPRYSAIPRTDSMSVNLGGDGLVPVVTAQPLPPQPSPIPIAAIPVVSKGAESEDCSLVDSLEDEAVVLARRNQARAAKAALSATGAPPPEESPARTPKPQTPLVGGEAFFVAIGSSSPATSISFSGSSPSPCSSEKIKQPPERVKKASMSVGPETVSAMPKRLRDRLAQRHRRLVQKMERQRNQRKKAEEMATAKKTIPRPPRLRNLSKAPSETQSKPSQPLRRVPLGHTNRTNIPQPGGRAAKPHGTSGPTPSPKGGTPMRTRGGNFQQKFKCIPEDRSLHLGSSTSSTPPSSLSASSNSDEEEVEVDVVSVEAGPETDAARLRPRLMSENAKKLGGRNRSRSGASRVPKPSKPHETGISELQTIKEESKGSMDTENEGKENGIKNQHAGDVTDEKLVNKENEEQVMAVPLNDSNNNMHYSVDLQGKRVDLVSQPGDANIIIKVEQNGDAQLEGAAPQPALKSGSDEDSRSSKSSTKSSSKRGSLKRQKTNESSTVLTDQVSHKGKVALGIENNNEDDLVSLSCGWLNFYLMHADLKSSCEEDESRSLRKEEKATARESRKEKELKPQKTVIRTSTHSRHAKVNPPDLSAPDPNGSGFPTKLPQIVSPQNSPTQETANLMSSTHPRSRLPRPLNPTRVQNTHNSLVPINSPSSEVARPTQLSFFPNPSRIPSDSSQAPHSSSPTSPSSSHPNDRGRHRHHRRRRGRDVEWGAEASTGTQTGESSQGWSVTIAGSCPQPDVEMRLTFPTANGRSRCSGNRGRQHQSDSGLGEENGMGRDRQGHAGGPTGQRQPSLLPSSIPLQEQHETWLLTLRNESTNAGGALEDGIGQRNSRLKPLKCLPEISYQPPSQDAGTKTRPNKVTVRANRASTLRLKSAHPGLVPAFLENTSTIPIADKGETNKSISMFWPKVRRAIEEKQLDHNDRDALRNEINAMEMMLGTRENIPMYRMMHRGTKLEIHGSGLNAAEKLRELERVEMGRIEE